MYIGQATISQNKWNQTQNNTIKSERNNHHKISHVSAKSTVNFGGIGGSLLRAIKKGASDASDFINKTEKVLVSRISKDSPVATPMGGTFDEIEKQAAQKRKYIEENYWFKSSPLNAVKNEELEAKRKELEKAQARLNEKQALANENLNIARGIPEQAAEYDRSHVLSRQNEVAQIQELLSQCNSTGKLATIAGYEREKTTLENVFLAEVQKEKNGEQANVCGSILFFGPTGNGKTTITKAIAEATGCNFKEIKLKVASKERQDKAMTEIETYAQDAEELFKSSKKRTIIFIDEIGKLTIGNKEVAERFEKFLETCSEKHHCTVFAATNKPLKLGMDTQKTDVFPIKFAIDPPDTTNTAEIFRHYLQPITEGEINHTLLAKTLIQDGNATLELNEQTNKLLLKDRNGSELSISEEVEISDTNQGKKVWKSRIKDSSKSNGQEAAIKGIYSNSQIKMICHDAFMKKNPTLRKEDFENYIEGSPNNSSIKLLKLTQHDMLTHIEEGIKAGQIKPAIDIATIGEFLNDTNTLL